MLRAAADPEVRARRQAGYTPEARRRMSEARKAYWTAHPEERESSLAKMRSSVRGGHYLSEIEARVCNALNALNLDYQIHRALGPYTADLFVRSASLDVECDGAYWHGRRPDEDESRDAWMVGHGYRVLRVPGDATQAQVELLLREALGL